MNTDSSVIKSSSVNSKTSKPVLGISECLLGKEVRFNGGHKQSKYITQVLSDYFDFKPVCPEVAIGMSIPRKPIRLAVSTNILTGNEVMGKDIRVIATDHPDQDYAQPLKNLATGLAPELEALSGYIFMQKSPSCGFGSSKIYSEKGHPIGSGHGAFAGELIDRLPLMPVTEAGRLNDNPIKENFIASVYAFHEWQTTVALNPCSAALIKFHHRHKLTLHAHNEKTATKLGNLLANLKQQNLNTVADQYIKEFMEAMQQPVSRKRHSNILVKLQRFLKKQTNEAEKQELSGLIKHYRNGVIPLVVPMTLLRYFMKKYQQHEALAMLEPYPMELGLENGI